MPVAIVRAQAIYDIKVLFLFLLAFGVDHQIKYYLYLQKIKNS